MTPETFAAAAGCSAAIAASFAGPMSAAMVEFGISAPTAQAMFIAQFGHETAGYSRTVEGLSYSAEALIRTWPSRFPTIDAARPYERAPERLANYVYAGRMGNGDEASGDGWRYRGRGVPMLTGRSNYAAAGPALGVDLVGLPDLLLQPSIGARCAGWFWRTRGCNASAEAGDVEKVTRLINGGLIGLDDRRARWLRAQAALRA